MNQIPDDVWACGWALWYWHDGTQYEDTRAFLIRATTFGEASARLKAIFENDARRAGAHGGKCFMNKNPGGAAVGSIDDGPFFQPDPTPDVTVEAPKP